MDLDDLHGIHYARPAVVVGGGPLTLAELDMLPDNAIIVSVNGHCACQLVPHFVVYCDAIGADLLSGCPGVHVSPFPHLTDVVLDERTPHDWWSTSGAVSLADWLGCGEIYLAGFDCYTRGGGIYASGLPARVLSVETLREKWTPVYHRYGDKLSPIGGPLLELFLSWRLQKI